MFIFSNPRTQVVQTVYTTKCCGLGIREVVSVAQNLSRTLSEAFSGHIQLWEMLFFVRVMRLLLQWVHQVGQLIVSGKDQMLPSEL